MVKGIPVYKVDFGEGMVQREIPVSQTFAYCIEATKGPVNEPVYVATNTDALKIFGVSFAPHFYQKGAGGLYLCRVGFPEMKQATLTYKAAISDEPSESKTVDVVRIKATTPGTSKHQVNIVKSQNSNKTYNVIVTIDGVGSKKYQNITSLENVVKRINDKFSEFIIAELLIDEKAAMALAPTEALIKTENGYAKKEITALGPSDDVIAKGPFNPNRLKPNVDSEGNIVTGLSGGSNGKLRTTKGEISSYSIPEGGIAAIPSEAVGTGDSQPNLDSTLLYAYREAFKVLEDKDVIGLATLSDSEVVQNELIEKIEQLSDPEVYKYRMGITALTDAKEPKTLADLKTAAVHIDNPFIVMIGQGVIFEEDGVKRKLPPHEAVQLYTGLRSALHYGESIYGGHAKKVLNGVKDTLPLTNDDIDIIREDIEEINESGLITFKKEYGEITFLEGVTTAQESPVLSHESVTMIVLNVLKRLTKVSKPFQGEKVTEDLRSSLVNTLNNELKNITDTDKTLVALEDYNIPPYAVDVKPTVISGLNEAGEYIRETHYLANIRIVPTGSLRDITLSVMVI